MKIQKARSFVLAIEYISLLYKGNWKVERKRVQIVRRLSQFRRVVRELIDQS